MSRNTALSVKLAVLSVITLACLPLFALRASADSNDDRSRALVNAERVKAGVGALPSDPRLVAVARDHTERMMRGEDVHHNPDLGADVDAAGADWRWVAENVGAGPDVTRIHDQFMASASHRAVLLHGSATAIGIAVGRGDDGRIYATHVYADVHAGDAKPAPAPPVINRNDPPPAPRQVEQVEPAPVVIRSSEPNVVIGGKVSAAVRLGDVARSKTKIPNPLPVATASMPTPLFAAAVAATIVAAVLNWSQRRLAMSGRTSV